MTSPKTNFYFDILIFIIFLVGLEPALTGITIHEWLNLAFAAILAVHLLLHWDCIVRTDSQFFRKICPSSRLNYGIDVLLFAVLSVTVLSGLMISQSVFGLVDEQGARESIWREWHHALGNIWLLLAALHFALHRGIIAKSYKRYLVMSFRQRLG